MNSRLFIFLLFIFANGYAQNPTDTLQLPEIEISALREITSMPFETIDSLKSKFQSLTHIAQFLKLNSSVFIREYASAGIMTISFRGTSSQHARLHVNGFPFDAVMSYQPDIHLAPAFLFDVLNVIPSPKALLYTHDAIGGLILLSSKPDTSQNIRVDIRMQTGSFQTNALAGSIAFRKKQFFTRTMSVWQNSENNYTYVNNTLPHRPMERRVNAGYSTHHIAQENAVYINNLSIHNYVLYSSLTQELPASLWAVQLDSNEIMHQQLLNNFTTLQLKESQKSYKIGLHTGIHDWTYLHKTLNIKSLNKVQKLRLTAENSFSLSNGVTFSGQLFIDHQQVNSNNYVNKKSVTISGLRTLVQQNKTKYRLSTAIHLLYHQITGFQLAGMAGWDFRLLNNTNISVHSGRSVRYPSLNELYWNPGGNPALKPEIGHHGTFTIGYKIRNNLQCYILTAHSLITNWILWQPSENITIWSPMNIKKVYCQTYETGIEMSRTIRKLQTRWTLSGSIIRSVDVSDKFQLTHGKHLIYVPLYQANGTFTVSYTYVNIQIQSSYTGKRFTNYDNTTYLPAFFQHHCTISITRNIKNFNLTAFMNVWNLTNENYQVIAWYPMPRRHFAIGLQLNF